MSFVLGVMGHVDHGKTALVRALTGMETDRLPEEQARGISIALGFAHMPAPGGGRIDLIDVPGHERFVRTAVSGATGMDAMLLVVDAREGGMPQTREHVFIASLLGIRRAIVAISRIDLATAEERHAAGAAAQSLAGSRLDVAACLAVSARTGEGVDALRQAILSLAKQASPRADDGVPWLPVDRAFSRPGHGTVVTGTLRRGRLAAGDTVEVAPGGMLARIRALQVHGARMASAGPGQRVAVNLRGIEPQQLGRGASLAAPGTLRPATWLSVRLTTMPDAPALATTQPVRLLLGTAEVDARLRLLDCDTLQPGQVALAQLRCAPTVSAPAHENFILRLASPAITIGGGVVLDPETVRLRRHSSQALSRLLRLAEADRAGIVAGEVTEAGLAGIGLARLARVAGCSPALAAGLVPMDRAVLLRGGEVVSLPALNALSTVLPRALAAHPAGAAPATLRALVPRAGAAVLDEAVIRLVASGVLARDGAAVRVARPDQDRATAQSASRLAAELAETLRASGLSPPDPAELAPDLARHRLLQALIRQGVIVRAPDLVQKREVLFHRDTIELARHQLSTLLTGDGLLVGEIGAALGISRKFSVPLLEYLDAADFTRRLGERRVLVARSK